MSISVSLKSYSMRTLQCLLSVTVHKCTECFVRYVEYFFYQGVYRLRGTVLKSYDLTTHLSWVHAPYSLYLPFIYVVLTILLRRVINKTLIVKFISDTRRPQPTTLVVPKKKKRICIFISDGTRHVSTEESVLRYSSHFVRSRCLEDVSSWRRP